MDLSGLKKAINSTRCYLGKLSMWGDKEYRLGQVAVYFCDLSVSFYLLRQMQVYDIDAITEPFSVTIPGDRPGYGIIFEPFLIQLTGSDGDIVWSSGGFDLTRWLTLPMIDEG